MVEEEDQKFLIPLRFWYNAVMNEYLNQPWVKRLMKWGLTLLVVFLALQTLNALKEWRSPGIVYSTIVVSGYGEAFATPDVATFSFSVSADAQSVGEAQNVVTGKTNAILEALKDLGIEEKDIRTSNYSVYPKYTYTQVICTPTYCPPSRQIPDGYSVSHSVDVKVRNVDDAGKALALAGEKGATNISSLAFSVDEADEVERLARNEAVEEARAKAKALAKSLGVRLGRVVDFSDNSYSPMPYMVRNEAFGGADMKVDAPTLPMGENRVTSNVTITYEIR